MINEAILRGVTIYHNWFYAPQHSACVNVLERLLRYLCRMELKINSFLSAVCFKMHKLNPHNITRDVAASLHTGLVESMEYPVRFCKYGLYSRMSFLLFLIS